MHARMPGPPVVPAVGSAACRGRSGRRPAGPGAEPDRQASDTDTRPPRDAADRQFRGTRDVHIRHTWECRVQIQDQRQHFPAVRHRDRKKKSPMPVFSKARRLSINIRPKEKDDPDTRSARSIRSPDAGWTTALPGVPRPDGRRGDASTPPATHGDSALADRLRRASITAAPPFGAFDRPQPPSTIRAAWHATCMICNLTCIQCKRGGWDGVPHRG